MHLSDHDIDRLIDDELSPAERRDLLRTLEATPDGWRRCALAFVESQALATEFRALGESNATTTLPEPSGLPAPLAASKRSPAAWLAIAASILAAFGLGLSSQLIPSGQNDAPATFVNNAVQSAAPANDILVQAPDSPNPDVITFWTRDEQGRRQSLRTRLVEADELRDQFGVELPSGASPDVRQDFERRGLRLESRRRYAPLNMDDGRTFVVPVEDMQVEPLPVSFL